jgi:hypothetical protein
MAGPAARVAPYKTVDELPEKYRAWLEHYFQVSHSLRGTAAAFGVSSQAVSYVRDCPAGQEYGLRLIGGNRNAINLFVAHLILDRLESVGGKIPLDLLVKIYGTSLPKETPIGAVEERAALARRLAREAGLSPEAEERMVLFAETGT